MKHNKDVLKQNAYITYYLLLNFVPGILMKVQIDNQL